MAKKHITLSVDELMIKKIKKLGIDRDQTVSELFEDWVRKL